MNLGFKLFLGLNVGIFRLTGGRLGSKMSGQKILLLTTTGAKTGKRRTVPVMQFELEGKRYVIGSYAGAPEDPAWIKNLRKVPEAEVEVPGEKYRARAVFLSVEARSKIFGQVKE